MTREVTGCGNCPFNIEDEIRLERNCYAPGVCGPHNNWSPRLYSELLPDGSGEYPFTPDWCPLKIEPITISMCAPLPPDYVSLDKIDILKKDGTIEPLFPIKPKDNGENNM
jgi:hypothetical protein